MSNSSAPSVASHSATGLSPRSHYVHLMSGRNFTGDVGTRRRLGTSRCRHIWGHSMWHKAMDVHIGRKITNKNISGKCLGNDLHWVHCIPVRTPGHVRLRRIHLLRSRSNNALLIARTSTNVHRYIVAIWLLISSLHLLCLWWLALLLCLLLLLLRLIVGIVCVRRHSRRRSRRGDCC